MEVLLTATLIAYRVLTLNPKAYTETLLKDKSPPDG